MAANLNFNITVEGVGDVSLPVTFLDDLLVKINGLETKTFRFTIQNPLSRDLSITLSSSLDGNAASKVTANFDNNPVVIPAAGETTVTATLVPLVGLVEGDLVTVTVNGTETVS